jgi:hypothetical protein
MMNDTDHYRRQTIATIAALSYIINSITSQQQPAEMPVFSVAPFLSCPTAGTKQLSNEYSRFCHENDKF